MRRTERLATAYIGRRLELLRLGKGMTAEEVARKIGMATTTYRWREIGVTPISIEFLELPYGPGD